MRADIAGHFRPEPEEDGLWGAIALAVALHVLLFLAMWVGWKWMPQRSMGAPTAGSPMVEASLMISAEDIKAAEHAVRTSPKPEENLPPPIAEEDATPPPQPVPEPRPQDAAEPQQQQAQDFIPEPDTRDQDRATRDSVSPETADREQETRRTQRQVDLTAEQRQQQAQNQRRLTEQQQREQQIADIQRRRQQAQRQVELEQQRLRQLEQAQQRAVQQQNTTVTAQAGTPGAGGQGGTSNDLLDKYKQAIQQQINSQWRRPDSVPQGVVCTVNIRQLPGGNVVQVDVTPGCPYDEAGKQSLQAAILRQPLPYRGFESVFDRNLIIDFKAQDM